MELLHHTILLESCGNITGTSDVEAGYHVFHILFAAGNEPSSALSATVPRAWIFPCGNNERPKIDDNGTFLKRHLAECIVCFIWLRELSKATV